MKTRFAPSPTGPLHLGHAYSAWRVWELAETLGGTALLRIEDTDSTRVRPEFENGIYEDLAWLGLGWPTPLRRQSDHYADYWRVLNALASLKVIYPCSCNRRAIKDAGAVLGTDGYVYPGTCRGRSMDDIQSGDAIRLNLHRAIEITGSDLFFDEISSGAAQRQKISLDTLFNGLGDPVLRRKESEDPAYHLACTYDDALQNISHVVRGADVQALTPIHVVLQRLMDWDTPVYLHHDLILGSDGKRLAKIDKSKSIAQFRQDGFNVDDIKQMVGL